MRILFASSEVYPFSKTGGLADVVGALPQALVELGHEVLVISPWYKTLKAEPEPLWIGDIDIPFDGGFESVGVGELQKDGVRYAFVGHDSFNTDTIYTGDDAMRYARFTRAAPQVAARVQFMPEVVHAHDWHTGFLPLVLTHGWHLPDGFAGLPSVFTIHNIQYQGFSRLDETLYWLRLPGALRDSYVNQFGAANAMQAALGFSDHVTTVSPTYAREIQTPEYGYMLDGTLRHIDHKLTGILNGIDTTTWDPESDPNIPERYTAETLERKAVNKRELCERFGLEPDRPLIGVVSRLAEQKGIDIFTQSVPGLLWQGWNVIVLGSGDPATERDLHHHSATNPGRFASYVGFDEPLSHHIYAGADAFAIPSRFEPCGLTQMIAMRYGTLPVARATGGLVDTIEHGETGYLFEHLNPEGLLWATSEATEAYHNGAHWREMQARAMAQNFSWTTSAKKYADLYRKLAA